LFVEEIGRSLKRGKEAQRGASAISTVARAQLIGSPSPPGVSTPG
jgi:hypothetical protein